MQAARKRSAVGRVSSVLERWCRKDAAKRSENSCEVRKRLVSGGGGRGSRRGGRGARERRVVNTMRWSVGIGAARLYTGEGLCGQSGRVTRM